MSDFLLALLVSVGGSIALSQIDQLNVLKQQQQSCSTEGGTWQQQQGQSFGTCYKAGQPIATQYSMMSPIVGLGVPVGLALLVTRSLPGTIGALAGGAGAFLYGISQIH